MATLKTTPTAPPDRVNGQPDVRGMDLDTLIALYPPKWYPTPQSPIHLSHLVSIILTLKAWFDQAERSAVVTGVSFIYYIDQRGIRRPIVADIFLAFDIDVDLLYGDESYFVERLGKPPSFVLEIGSPATARADLNVKRRVYAHIGIAEFWLFDYTGGKNYGFPLQGLRLTNGVYAPIEMETLPDGSVQGHSDALGLDLRWVNGNLRLLDPVTGGYLETPDEMAEALRREEEERQLAEERAVWEAKISALQKEVARLRGEKD